MAPRPVERIVVPLQFGELVLEPIGLAYLRLGRAADQHGFPILAVVQPVRLADAFRLRLVVAAGSGMWMSALPKNPLTGGPNEVMLDIKTDP
jgi:hypothetical protein